MEGWMDGTHKSCRCYLPVKFAELYSIYDKRQYSIDAWQIDTYEPSIIDY